MKAGDMVTHKTNPAWKRGKIYGLIPGPVLKFMVMWGNGDLEPALLEDLEPLGWNIYERGNKN
tara:strand:- start:153 stop:341 length:189 start_codon:yes stop_codon:yes gene_type:complete